MEENRQIWKEEYGSVDLGKRKMLNQPIARSRKLDDSKLQNQISPINKARW